MEPGNRSVSLSPPLSLPSPRAHSATNLHPCGCSIKCFNSLMTYSLFFFPGCHSLSCNLASCLLNTDQERQPARTTFPSSPPVQAPHPMPVSALSPPCKTFSKKFPSRVSMSRILPCPQVRAALLVRPQGEPETSRKGHLSPVKVRDIAPFRHDEKAAGASSDFDGFLPDVQGITG